MFILHVSLINLRAATAEGYLKRTPSRPNTPERTAEGYLKRTPSRLNTPERTAEAGLRIPATGIEASHTQAGHVKAPGTHEPSKLILISEPPLTIDPQSTEGHSESEGENEDDETLLSREPVGVPRKAESHGVGGLADLVQQ